MYFRQFCIDLRPDFVCSDGHQCPRVRQTHKYGAFKLVNVISDSSWKLDIKKKKSAQIRYHLCMHAPMMCAL